MGSAGVNFSHKQIRRLGCGWARGRVNLQRALKSASLLIWEVFPRHPVSVRLARQYRELYGV